MSQGKKTDAITKAKVLEAKVNNPDLSTRAIGKEVGIDNTTVSDILNSELPQLPSQSQRVASLIDSNNNLISLADQLLTEKLKKGEEHVRVGELVQVRESAFKQNQLLGGKPTERIKHDFSELSDEELASLINDANESLQ